jgi:hypothetical protein
MPRQRETCRELDSSKPRLRTQRLGSPALQHNKVLSQSIAALSARHLESYPTLQGQPQTSAFSRSLTSIYCTSSSIKPHRTPIAIRKPGLKSIFIRRSLRRLSLNYAFRSPVLFSPQRCTVDQRAHPIPTTLLHSSTDIFECLRHHLQPY